jgi:cytochrome c-type biogenesis protein CcmH
VTPLFLFLAGVMLATAMFLVLRPLLRGGGVGNDHRRKLDALDRALADGVLDEAEFGRKRKALLAEQAGAPAPRASLLPVLGLSLLLPLGAILVYLTVGTPQGLDPALASAPAGSPDSLGGSAGGAGTPQMDQAIAGLEKRLEAEPGNVDGWTLLGRAYRATERFDDARGALKKAFDLAPNSVEVMVEYAEAIALTDPGRDITGESKALLEQALADDPKQQRALWLLGISEAQVGNYAGAITRWEALLPLLDPADTELRTQVEGQLAEARARAGLPAVPGATPAAAPAAAPAPAPAASMAQADPAPVSGGASLTIEVDISAELKAQLAPTDVLYVFARAAEGPRMPLAIQRLPGARFPLTLKLDDSMAMMPTMNLSSTASVVVGARVSKTGVANPQSGDFEVISAPLSPTGQTAPVKLVIDQVVP